MPFGGPTHERLAPVDDESPQTTSSGDVWAQIQHGTCNSSANATGFDRALTYSPPFFVRAHQTTKEDCTPGTLKASQVALVEPVAYLKDLVTYSIGIRGSPILQVAASYCGLETARSVRHRRSLSRIQLMTLELRTHHLVRQCRKPRICCCAIPRVMGKCSPKNSRGLET